MYERNRAAFGVEARTKREGKSATTWMYRQGCAGRPGGAGASAGAAGKKRARARAGSRRGAPPRIPVPQVHRPVAEGRRSAAPAGLGPERGRPQGGRVRPQDRRGPIVDLLVDSGTFAGRRCTPPAPPNLLARSVRDAFARSAQDAREVLFERGFPKPTDAIKRAIGEAARMELAEHSRRRDPAASTAAAAAVEVDQSAYISKDTAIRGYRENEGAREDASARVRGAAASVVTASPPKDSEEGERLRRRSTRHARDVAALTGGVLDAAASDARARAHAFFASEAFGGSRRRVRPTPRRRFFVQIRPRWTSRRSSSGARRSRWRSFCWGVTVTRCARRRRRRRRVWRRRRPARGSASSPRRIEGSCSAPLPRTETRACPSPWARSSRSCASAS